MGKKTSWGEGGWIEELTMEGKKDSRELEGSEIQGKWKLEVEEEAQDHSSSSFGEADRLTQEAATLVFSWPLPDNRSRKGQTTEPSCKREKTRQEETGGRKALFELGSLRRLRKDIQLFPFGCTAKFAWLLCILKESSMLDDIHWALLFGYP